MKNLLFIVLVLSVPLLFMRPSIASSDKIRFNKDQPFEIIHYHKGSYAFSSEKDTSMCIEWKISEQRLPVIIKNLRFISGEAWHHEFDVLPCQVRGKIKQGENYFDFELNAGAWMYLTCPDTTFILGNFHKANEKYFLSTADTHGG